MLLPNVARPVHVPGAAPVPGAQVRAELGLFGFVNDPAYEKLGAFPVTDSVYGPFALTVAVGPSPGATSQPAMKSAWPGLPSAVVEVLKSSRMTSLTGRLIVTVQEVPTHCAATVPVRRPSDAIAPTSAAARR